MAALLHQFLFLGIGFHAFGNHLQAQGGRQGNDGGDNAQAALIDTNVAYKGLVDLELVHREMPQIGQAGIAGTEVVDRQPHTQIHQLVQGGRHLLDVVHQR